MKISIITPTYNDAKFITEMLISLEKQTYKNWELILVDDGSTDNTKQIIKNYMELHKNLSIKYIYQENQDQLNAILNALNYITGQYIYILHSDDKLIRENSLEQAITFIKENECDAAISDLELIDSSSKIIGHQKVRKYKYNEYCIPLQLLWLGRNLYCDTAMVKKEIYLSKIKYNYLTWNTSFWLDLQDIPKILNVKNLQAPIMEYRISNENYIKNEIGQLNVINGELRTIAHLMKYYYIPFYKLQYFLYRIFNKLNISKYYIPLYLKKETKNKGKIIDFAIKKRYKNNYKKYQILNSIHNYYKNNSKRAITIKNIDEDEFIYKGKDIRKFNVLMQENKLSHFYTNILNEMNIGFNTVITTKKDYDKIKDILNFLCVYPNVKIVVEEKKHENKAKNN